MDYIHHWTFQGVDTSHFVTPQEGDIKIIGGVEYEYVLVNGLLKLIPTYELPKKRENAGDKPEARNAVLRIKPSTKHPE